MYSVQYSIPTKTLLSWGIIIVLISDGISEISAHVETNLNHLLFDLFKAFDKIRSSHKSDFSLSHLFSLICAQHILSYHLIYIPWVLIFSCNTFCTSVHCLLDKLLNFLTLLNAFSYSNFLEHHS